MTAVSRKEIKSKYQSRKFVSAERFAWCKTALPKLRNYLGRMINLVKFTLMITHLQCVVRKTG